MQSNGLQQSLTQTTKLTPTQIQVIRMLELPSIELSQRINEELQENPALEEGKDEGVMEEGMNGEIIDGTNTLITFNDVLFDFNNVYILMIIERIITITNSKVVGK